MRNEESLDVTATIDGETRRARVLVRQSLADFMRHDLGLTGTHVGCEHGVRGCLMFAAQIDGYEVMTIETPNPPPAMAALQDAFFERVALQSGFCTSGMIMQACALLGENPRPAREQIHGAISGNHCRCTGCHAFVDAVQQAAAYHSETPS